MWLRTVSRFLSVTSTRRRRNSRSRLGLESLESRCLLSFGAPTDYGADLAPQVVVSADFNGDGRTDLAAANTNTLSLLLGNGDGTFQPALTSAAGYDTKSMRAADLNADGKIDLVTVSANYGLDVRLGNGNGTFAQPIVVDFGTIHGISSFTSAVLADFDGNLNSPTNAAIADGQGVGTIVDDEPRVSISDVSKKEGKKNQTTLFTFTVTLSSAYDQSVTMSYTTMDGTAKTSDGDYFGKTGTLTFAPGETTKTITIDVKGDSRKESDETFYLDLFGNSSNSLFAKNRGLGRILNDD